MLRSLLILSILVPGVVAAVSNPFAALIMYLWFALFRPQEWLWIDITSLRASLMLGVILFGRSLIGGILPNATHPLSLGFLLFLGATLLAQVSAVSPDIGWTWIDFLSRLFLTCMLMVALVGRPKQMAAVVAVIGGSLGFHAAKAGLAYVLGGGALRFNDGLSGAFVDNNGYALGTVMILPLLVVTAQTVGTLYSGRWLPWVRRGFFAAVPLCMFAVIGTYSRGGFLALASAALVFILLQKRRFTTLATLLAVLTLLLLVVPIPQSYLDRLQTIRTYDKIGETSAQSRPHFWRVGLRMLADHPLGVGLKQYEAAYDRYDFSFGKYGHHRAVHNAHVQVLVEIGYMGALVWAAMFAYAFFACFRVRKRSRDERLDAETRQFLFVTANGLLTSMAGFIVGGSFLSLAFNDITWLTFAMVASLDRVSRTVCEEAANEPIVSSTNAVPLAFRVVPSYGMADGGPA